MTFQTFSRSETPRKTDKLRETEELHNGYRHRACARATMRDRKVSPAGYKRATQTYIRFHVQNIWELRERLAEAQTKEGYLFKYDISLPLENFYNIVSATAERLKGANYRFITGFGHVGKYYTHVIVAL